MADGRTFQLSIGEEGRRAAEKKPAADRVEARAEVANPLWHKVATSSISRSGGDLPVRAAGDPWEQEANRIAEANCDGAPSRARELEAGNGLRLHTDSVAAEAASGLGARALTVGRDVYFGRGEYAPETSAGRQLLAHELTHVAQQTGGGGFATPLPSPAVQRQPKGPGVSLTEPSLGSVNFRVREDGRLEIVAGLPEAPVAGSLGIGARRDPDGRWRPVFGRNVTPIGSKTYSWEEILDLLRGAAGGGTRGTAPGLPGATGLPGLPGLPGSVHPSPPILGPPLPGLRPPGGGLGGLSHPSLTLPEPTLDLTRGERVVIDRFEVDRSTVPSTQEATLDGLAMRLLAQGVRAVLLTGHTDTTGTEAHNEGLSVARAAAVKAALVARGMDDSLIYTEGSGEREPAVTPERTADDRARNRRVEVFWVRPAEAGPRLRLDLPPIVPGGGSQGP